jgi:hypothetical protein
LPASWTFGWAPGKELKMFKQMLQEQKQLRDEEAIASTITALEATERVSMIIIAITTTTIAAETRGTTLKRRASLYCSFRSLDLSRLTAMLPQTTRSVSCDPSTLTSKGSTCVWSFGSVMSILSISTTRQVKGLMAVISATHFFLYVFTLNPE